MKHTIKSKARQLAQNPAARKALVALKPEKSLWGFLGIVFFLVVPEVVAFIWGEEITRYAKIHAAGASSFFERQYYEMLMMLFEEGGSWFNLAIAAALLVWFFY